MGQVRKIIENFNARRTFNAQNCLKLQKNEKESEEDRELKDKIEQITGRITNVVHNELDEHMVMYHVPSRKRDFFEHISNYFTNLGFSVKIGTIPWVSETDEFMVISWE